jgi:hypothetical protein
MSLTFIYDFQNRIYSTLLNDKDIMLVIKKIYIGVIQDGISPFLLINIEKVEDLSVHNISLYEVEFQISAYAKDQNHQLLVNVSDLIIKNLSTMNRLFGFYKIEGIKANNMQFEKAKDLVLNRLVINYKAFIKSERY